MNGGEAMLKEIRLPTYLYKACPRCHGDLMLDDEQASQLALNDTGIGYVCLQCGRHAAVKTAKVEKQQGIRAA
jgi:hypothetical protein